MSFQQALSGLNASSQNLDVIGNNIANANTYGAKSSSVVFADMYANALNGSTSSQAGIGVNVQAITQHFSQGTIEATSNANDLAINGAGFFHLIDPQEVPERPRNIRAHQLQELSCTLPQAGGVSRLAVAPRRLRARMAPRGVGVQRHGNPVGLLKLPAQHRRSLARVVRPGLLLVPARDGAAGAVGVLLQAPLIEPHAP